MSQVWTEGYIHPNDIRIHTESNTAAGGRVEFSEGASRVTVGFSTWLLFQNMTQAGMDSRKMPSCVEIPITF